MKAPRVILILGVGAVGWAVGIAALRRPASPTPATPDLTPSTSAPVAPVPTPMANPSAKPSAAPASDSAPSAFTWQQVESSEFSQYIANLRAIRCPEQTIQDIITAEINKLYAPREAPLKVSRPPTKTGTPPPAPPEELENRKKLREIQIEKRAVLKELLGIDLPLDVLPSSSSRNYDAFELAFKLLPAEKRDTVQTAQENYWQQSDALKAQFNNKRTPEFVEQHRQLTDELRQELGRVLTPTELENYEIRTSATASKLGTQLATFAPTEDEFRKIFRATRDLEEKAARATEAAGKKQRTPEEQVAAANRLNDQLRTALGDTRFAEYQRAQDGHYQNLSRVGQRYGIPAETVLQAYELEKAFQSQAQPFVATPGIDPNAKAALARERAAALQQLNENITAVLGEKAARAYRQLRGGFRAPELEQ